MFRNLSLVLLVVFLLLSISSIWSMPNAQRLAIKPFRSSYDVCINELMASNESTIADEDGDFEDWVEIYNRGSEVINLEGWGLSDSQSNPYRWVFPAVSIEPGHYMLVWCSKKNRSVAGQPLHTDYGISASGEEVLLTHANGELVDMVPATPLSADISLGRYPNGTGAWFFFDQPTPLASNETNHFSEILSEPSFSVAGGFYTSEFDLVISHPDPEVTILYTLDGSEPDIGNLDGKTYQYKNSYPQNPGDPFGDILINSYYTMIYEAPIAIYDRSSDDDYLTQISSTWELNPAYFPVSPVAKGIAIRAKAFKPGALSSDTVSNSYFIFSEGRNRYSLPVVSLSIQEDLLFDYNDGIYTAGVDFDNWRQRYPNEPISETKPTNWRREGDEWEYPGNVEFFYPDNPSAVINQRIGFKIHGGASSAKRSKSLRLYARDIYGNSDFSYPFFADQPYTSYKRLILRNSGSDFMLTLLHDASIHEVMKGLHFETQAYQPAITFINGEYWGILNIRERYDKHYLARVYGVDKENLDLLERGGSITVYGDRLHYNAMLNFINSNDMSDPACFDYVSTQMDIDNFIDYYIAEIFINNRDWPQNNIKCWRLRKAENDPTAAYGKDGRWRWLFYDADLSFSPLSYVDTNSLVRAYEHSANASTIFARLLVNNEFRDKFINRFADLLNSQFQATRVASIFNLNKQGIESEILEQTDRWRVPGSFTTWNNRIAALISFANQRPAYQRQHIREFFELGDDIQITLDTSDQEHGILRINTVDISSSTPGISDFPYPWTGSYFNGIPIEVEAIPKPGYKFSHWEGDLRSTDSILTIIPTVDTQIKAVFEESTLDGSEIVHYWHFNELPSGTLETVNADYSAIDQGKITYPGSGDGYMDARTHRAGDPVSNLNLQMEQGPDQGAVLRVRNPSNTRELIIDAPSTGFEAITGAYATARSGNGATQQELYYSIDAGVTWIQIGASYSVSELPNWNLKTFDLSDISTVDDNPDLKLRIIFGGDNADLDAGNDRFDNFSMHGVPLPMENYPPVVVTNPGIQYVIENGEKIEISLLPLFEDEEGDALEYSTSSSRVGFVSAVINGNTLELTPHRRGDAIITINASDGINPEVSLSFRVLVYPEAAKLSELDFTFEAWAASTPELVYPNHMLFLQSDIDDPNLDYPLNYAYYVEHNQYHNNDSASVGFPYQLTGRSRLNGLDENGIAFINTGQGRDLGAALVAIDTRNVEQASLQWLAGTVLKNKRTYGIRLQYRIGIDGAFFDLMDEYGNVIEYISGEDGDVHLYPQIHLPDEILGKEYVQLLWKYYYISGSGARAQLRLDDIILTSDKDDTLPVQLSHFSAAIAENKDVRIRWISQTESGLAGYYVYRNDISNLGSAKIISPIIPATNTNIEQEYSFCDEELYEDNTYYYWLQSMELSGETVFYGPLSIAWSIDGDHNAPDLPLITELGLIYPNPFNPDATIPFTLAAASEVNIEIYNIKGQKVRSYKLGTKEAGYHRHIWDGKDEKGKSLSSGLYYFLLKTQKDRFLKKALMLK